MAISDQARAVFMREMQARGQTPELLDDGAYRVNVGTMSLTISLENKGRAFDESGDEDIIKHFVNMILESDTLVPRSWDAAKAHVYLSAEPADHDFGDTCRFSVSDQVELVLVYIADQGEHIVWLTPAMLTDLGVSREVAEHAATQNMARLLDDTTIDAIPVDEHTLGAFATASPLKASLIFAANLREKVEPRFGWPIFAVIPCRDFAYLIPESAQELFSGIGQVVIKEYTKRGYPISTEVFKIDSERVIAIGEFQSPYNPPKGMRAIEHDNLLTFFLPRAWEEEARDDDDFIYFDPAEEENFLSVVTKVYEAEDTFPEDMAHQVLQSFAEENQTEVQDWPNQRASVHYTGEFDDMQTWTWIVAGPVTPKHQGLALFTYHLPREEANSAASQATIQMLDEMLPRALFRSDFLDTAADEE